VIGAAPRPSRLLMLMAAVAAVACAAPLRAQEKPTPQPTVEDSVWAAVLASDFAPAGGLVVRARTSGAREGPSGGSPSEGRPQGIESGTVEDFRERNEHPREVGPLPGIRVPVTFASEATLDSLADRKKLVDVDAFWRAFYRRFPGTSGLVTFSRVGFNPARTQAVVSVSHGCGGLCGSGSVVLLARDPDGGWRVVRSASTWVS